MIVWKKGNGQQLSTHFHAREFECHCDSCTDQTIDEVLIESLEAIRYTLGIPLSIHSGYRCSAYQQKLRDEGFETAKGTSQHELGRAADVACADMKALEAECPKYFKAIGVARFFIHVDRRLDKERRWSYIST